MTTRLIRRAAAALALALAVATPALTIAPGAEAATHAAARTKQEPTTLRIATSGRVADQDTGQATISGWLTKNGVAYPGQTVLLKSRPGARAGHHFRWGVLNTGVTSADGTVSFTVTPQVRTRYRLVFPQNAEARSSASRVVAVAPRIASRLLIKAVDTARGLRIWGHLKAKGHDLPGRRVTLQVLQAGAAEWTAVKSKWTHRHGHVRFLVASPADGASYRLFWAGSQRFRSATSSTVTP